jgi:hypothetical protein
MSPQELQVQKRREQDGKEEGTIPARTFLPTADICEDRDSFKVLLERPGVEKGQRQRSRRGRRVVCGRPPRFGRCDPCDRRCRGA